MQASKAKTPPKQHGKRPESRQPHSDVLAMPMYQPHPPQQTMRFPHPPTVAMDVSTARGSSGVDSSAKPAGKKTGGPGRRKNPARKRRLSGGVRTPRRVAIIRDEAPDRIVNPLLEAPAQEPAQATEIWPLMQVLHPLPNTYPVSFYAKLLGFQVQPRHATPGRPHVCMEDNPKLIRTVQTIPPEGCWARQEDEGMDYCDPLYRSIREGFQTSSLRPAQAPKPPQISQECLQLVQRNHIVDSSEWEFEYWPHVQEWPFRCRNLTATSSATPLSTTGPFWIVASEKQCPSAYLQYQFQWYNMQPSAASANNVSELVLTIDDFVGRQENALQEGRPLPDTKIALVLLALVLEHARACSVWYALVRSPPQLVPLLEEHFRMTKLDDSSETTVTLLCELQRYSLRYAFMHPRPDSNKPTCVDEASIKHRLWVRMPNQDDARAALVQSPIRSRRSLANRKSLFTGANAAARSLQCGIRAKIHAETMELHRLMPDDKVVPCDDNIKRYPNDIHVEILKSFPVATPPQDDASKDNFVLNELLQKQTELEAIESGMEPKLRSLLKSVMDERLDYESPQAVERRVREQRILEENKKMVARRREMDLAWQKQLEHDMDAVCDICDDGEVTPDNQILFCEACNVAVHQVCYGIEEVPEGDYYCIACQYFNRKKMSEAVARQMLARDPTIKISSPPLPICCELCPRKEGAYIRTYTPPPPAGQAPSSKWVHSLCAKWMGLEFCEKPAVVESVAELKIEFLRLGHRCALCTSERGGFHKCKEEKCEKWLHITCARLSGLCEVVHGEDAKGGVIGQSAWTLRCPEHSNIPEDERRKDAVPIEKLIEAAKKFPPEPKPPPKPLKPRPFHKLTGKERVKYLADANYEQLLFQEICTKKVHGMHCEACDQYDETGSFLRRCGTCGVAFCDQCTPKGHEIKESGKTSLCAACQYVATKKKKKEAYIQPQCNVCCQKHGWLLRAHANPVNPKGSCKSNPKKFAKTFFAQDLWVHAVCGYWNAPRISVTEGDGLVDLSNVIMTRGNAHILGNRKCGLCGQNYGLTPRCIYEGCTEAFHPTCARQACLEVSDYPGLDGTIFGMKCYRHSGHNHNFRARLEDLIEIERRRAGPTFKTSEAPMPLSHASRLLNASIDVMRMLGWAWRWADWWVEFDSSWEPLLEEGQKEEDMTPEELKIVESTRESRCADARKCRLAAFGAALRNRNYDTKDGFNDKALKRALRAVLLTKSLSGPLERFEIDFYVDWLSRAYRTKSRLLGFGEHKTDVALKEGSHLEDKSPKFELGSRPIPGLQDLPAGEYFERGVVEVDDFLKYTPPPLKVEKGRRGKKRGETKGSKKSGAGRGGKKDDKEKGLQDDETSRIGTKRGRRSKRSRDESTSDISRVQEDAPPPRKRKRGRSKGPIKDGDAASPAPFSPESKVSSRRESRKTPEGDSLATMAEATKSESPAAARAANAPQAPRFAPISSDAGSHNEGSKDLATKTKSDQGLAGVKRGRRRSRKPTGHKIIAGDAIMEAAKVEKGTSIGSALPSAEVPPLQKTNSDSLDKESPPPSESWFPVSSEGVPPAARSNSPTVSLGQLIHDSAVRNGGDAGTGALPAQVNTEMEMDSAKGRGKRKGKSSPRDTLAVATPPAAAAGKGRKRGRPPKIPAEEEIQSPGRRTRRGSSGKAAGTTAHSTRKDADLETQDEWDSQDLIPLSRFKRTKPPKPRGSVANKTCLDQKTSAPNSIPENSDEPSTEEKPSVEGNVPPERSMDPTLRPPAEPKKQSKSPIQAENDEPDATQPSAAVDTAVDAPHESASQVRSPGSYRGPRCSKRAAKRGRLLGKDAAATDLFEEEKRKVV